MNKKFYISILAIFLLYLSFVIGIKPKLFEFSANEIYKTNEDNGGREKNTFENYEELNSTKLFDYLSGEDEIIYRKIIENDNSSKMNESRELTQNENERMLKLRNQYYQENLMPKMYLIYNAESILPKYNFEKNEIIYPTEEMTDEQLLQLIDFSASLSHFTQIDFNSAQSKLKEKSMLVLSEEDIKNNMIEHIEKLYNVSISDMNINFNFQDGFWNLFVEPKNINALREQKKIYWIYSANTDDNSSEIIEIDSYYSSRKIEDSKVPENLSEEENDLFSKKAKEILISNILYDKDVDEVLEIEKYISSESNGTSIRVVFLVSNANCYDIELAYPSKAVIGYNYYENREKYDERSLTIQH